MCSPCPKCSLSHLHNLPCPVSQMTTRAQALARIEEIKRINQLPADLDIGWLGENETITELCDTLKAVLEIEYKNEFVFDPSLTFQYKFGHNKALQVVKALIIKGVLGE